jgi:hypothetical protein
VTEADHVKSNFDRELKKSVDLHLDLMAGTRNKVNQAALETMLVEQFSIGVAVRWESFLSDLIMAYASMYPQTAISTLNNRIQESVKGKFGEKVARCTVFAVKTPVTWDRLGSLLDPQAWNITCRTSTDLAAKANALLEARFAQSFSLSKADSEFFDFAVSLRNFLSHRSTGSRKFLKQALAKLSDPINSDFAARLGGIGPYLKFKNGNGKTRAVLLAERFISIATTL